MILMNHNVTIVSNVYSRTYIPPAFYGRDGSFVQPPSFEMNIESFADRICSQQRDQWMIKQFSSPTIFIIPIFCTRFTIFLQKYLFIPLRIMENQKNLSFCRSFCTNIDSKSLNNTFLNIIKIFFLLLFF